MYKVPDLLIIHEWLAKLNIESYTCQHCHALHLYHLQQIDDVFDAKVEIIDEVIIFTIAAEVKSSALLTISSELSHINSSTVFVKTYLELVDNANPKIIFSYTLNGGEGVSFTQFSLFISTVEDEALQIISELSSCDLLSHYDTMEEGTQKSVIHTYH